MIVCCRNVTEAGRNVTEEQDDFVGDVGFQRNIQNMPYSTQHANICIWMTTRTRVWKSIFLYQLRISDSCGRLKTFLDHIFKISFISERTKYTFALLNSRYLHFALMNIIIYQHYFVVIAVELDKVFMYFCASGTCCKYDLHNCKILKYFIIWSYYSSQFLFIDIVIKLNTYK